MANPARGGRVGQTGVDEISAHASLFVAVKQKQIRRGVKEVQKFVNKGEKG